MSTGSLEVAQIKTNQAHLYEKLELFFYPLVQGPPHASDEAEKKGSKLGRNVITLMDTALAAQNIMLCAYEQGIGTCLIASFHPGSVQEILHLPPPIVPQLLMSLGYPHIKSQAPKRNSNVVWFNEYSQ